MISRSWRFTLVGAYTFRAYGEADVMYRLVALFFQDRSGTTSIEYGLIAVGITGAIIATVYALGTKAQELFALVNERFQ